MNFTEASNLPVSEKISLVTCEATRKAKLFELVSGTIYKAVFSNFVLSVKNGTAALDLASSSSVSLDEYYYDIPTKTLYLNVGGDPASENIILTHKLFFSTTPLILPHDLSTGDDVEWTPIVSIIASIGQQLDDENTGIVLESQSSVTFINQHGFFDDIFDSLIFENQKIEFYSWFGGLPRSEIKKIFSGVVESKSFTSKNVRFNVKDLVYKLRASVKSDTFIPGTLESLVGKPRRRVYGKMKQLQTVPTDCILSGYNLSGLVSAVLGSKNLNGSTTQFLKELKQGDQVTVNFDGSDISYTIDSVTNDTLAILTQEARESFTGLGGTVSPENGYRFKNRTWEIAGHKIKRVQQTITQVYNDRTIGLADTSELSEGDTIYIVGNSQAQTIFRVGQDRIVLFQDVFPSPTVGGFVVREAVSSVYADGSKLLINRDYLVVTSDSGSYILLDDLAEFNVARQTRTSHALQFSYNSRQVTSAVDSDLRTIIKPGYFIAPEVQNTQSPESLNWYEVTSVAEKEIYLNRVFNDGTINNRNQFTLIKNTSVINDDSIVVVDCYGMDRGNKWIKTASDAVLDLVVNDAGITNINTDSFDDAALECDYVVSLAVPEIGGNLPIVRDLVVSINNSVFGSLYYNIDQELSYSIVNTRKPLTIKEVKDDDLIDWDISTEQRIINAVKANYRPFCSLSGDDSFELVESESDFVNEMIGIDETVNTDLYLYSEQGAESVANRLLFYRSLSNSVVRMKAKANFFNVAVNDMILLDLDRIYRRYGGSSYKKIGIVSGVKKSQYDSEVSVNDLGNIFNRCPSVGPSSMSEFTDATEDEKIKYGFILDSETLIPGSDENYLGSGLIG